MSTPLRRLLIAALVLVLCICAGFGYVVLGKLIEAAGQATLASTPLPDITETPTQSTRIYDRDGQLLYEFGATRREVITIDDVPLDVRNAFLAAEDRTFYSNLGISIRSLVRAIHVDVSQEELSQGGSTITQQLAQQLVVEKDHTLQRKMREIAVSLVLTRRYTKDQILERYLNEVPVGGELIGIGTAAKVYFGKPISELTLAEGAYLAALINAPSILDPYSNPEGLAERQELILSRMGEFGFLDQAGYNRAMVEDVTFDPRRTTLKQPHFSFFVKKYLEEQFGEEVVDQGLEVITTLDSDMQAEAQAIIDKRIEQNTKQWGASNAAMISLNPKNGQVLVYIGGQDFKKSQVDVLSSGRHPGSTIKPLIYYTALAQGYSTDTYVLDAAEDFGGGYRPLDYGGTASGRYLPIRTALAASLNIPAVRVLRGVGIQDATQNLDRMGFPVDPNRQYTLPLGLGAIDATPFQMAQAYTTLATGGRQLTASPLLKVTDRTGKVLVDNSKARPGRRILDANAVAGITYIISDQQIKRSLYGGSLLTNYTLPDRPVAAKTGTSSGPKDAWIIGFTPSILTVVWTGNNSGANLNQKADGINVAAPIWREYMVLRTKDTEVETFPKYEKPKPLEEEKRYIDRKPRITTIPQSSASVTPAP